MLADEGAATRLGCDSCEDLAAPPGAAFRHGGDPRISSRPTVEARGIAWWWWWWWCCTARQTFSDCKIHLLNSHFNDTRQLGSSEKGKLAEEAKARLFLTSCQETLQKRMTLSRHSSNDDCKAQFCCSNSHNYQKTSFKCLSQDLNC